MWEYKNDWRLPDRRFKWALCGILGGRPNSSITKKLKKGELNPCFGACEPNLAEACRCRAVWRERPIQGVAIRWHRGGSTVTTDFGASGDRSGSGASDPLSRQTCSARRDWLSHGQCQSSRGASGSRHLSGPSTGLTGTELPRPGRRSDIHRIITLVVKA